MRDTGVPHVMEIYHNLSLYWGIIQFIHPELTLIVFRNEMLLHSMPQIDIRIFAHETANKLSQNFIVELEASNFLGNHLGT